MDGGEKGDQFWTGTPALLFWFCLVQYLMINNPAKLFITCFLLIRTSLGGTGPGFWTVSWWGFFFWSHQKVRVLCIERLLDLLRPTHSCRNRFTFGSGHSADISPQSRTSETHQGILGEKVWAWRSAAAWSGEPVSSLESAAPTNSHSCSSSAPSSVVGSVLVWALVQPLGARIRKKSDVWIE